MGLVRSFLHTVARGLVVAACVWLLVGLIDIIVFRLPARERQSYDTTFRKQCQSVRPGTKLAEVEAIFGSSPFAFSIERRDSTVEVKHRSTVCVVSLLSGSDSIANAKIEEKSEPIGWEQ